MGEEDDEADYEEDWEEISPTDASILEITFGMPEVERVPDISPTRRVTEKDYVSTSMGCFPPVFHSASATSPTVLCVPQGQSWQSWLRSVRRSSRISRTLEPAPVEEESSPKASSEVSQSLDIGMDSLSPPFWFSHQLDRPSPTPMLLLHLMGTRCS